MNTTVDTTKNVVIDTALTTTKKNATILIVEDEELVAEDIKSHVIEMGYIVSAIVNCGEDALTLLEGSRPDLVLMDIVLAGGKDGIDVAKEIKTHYLIPVIYLTAYTDREMVERAQSTEPYGYLIKPFDERELRTTISMALYKAEADRKQRDSHTWSHSVLNSIADGVITSDIQGRIQYLNSSAESLSGWSIDNVKGRKIDDVFLFDENEQQELFDNTFLGTLQGNDKPVSNSVEGDLICRNGTKLPVGISISAIHYQDKQKDGAVIAFRDISLHHMARKLLEKNNADLEQRVAIRTYRLEKANIQLEKAKEQAEKANKAKSQFISNMTHELRTPLNPAIGFADLLLEDDELSSQQRESVQEIRKACTTLLRLITNMLKLADTETSDTKRQSNPIELTTFTRNVFKSFQRQTDAKGLTMEVILPEVPEFFVLGDAAILREVLELLLENAIKFTRQGKITLQLNVSRPHDEHVFARFTISDTGIGIPESMRDNIFNIFTQVDESNTRHYGGAGLGLAVCKHHIENMGGTIGVDSNPEGGSVFWFELKFSVLDD